MKSLDEYEETLLTGWEEVYKKGQLTLWIFLALKDSPKHMAGIKQFINDATNGSLVADDQSMYRALRKFNDTDMIAYTSEPSESGPDLKVYGLTETGAKVLDSFVKRNVIEVFFKPEIKHLVERSV